MLTAFVEAHPQEPTLSLSKAPSLPEYTLSQERWHENVMLGSVSPETHRFH